VRTSTSIMPPIVPTSGKLRLVVVESLQPVMLRLPLITVHVRSTGYVAGVTTPPVHAGGDGAGKALGLTEHAPDRTYTHTTQL
jgi:hypothetical protein